MILEALYLILPGIFANMAPVLFKRVPLLDYPVDFNKKFHGKPIFGANKTYRGFFFGILFAVVIVLLQQKLYAAPSFQEVSLIDYSQTNVPLLGFLMGFGVLFGDLVKSFFKRRRGIAPGAPWFPFDQLDALVGGLLFTSILYRPPRAIIILLLLLVPLLHLVLKYAGYLFGIQKNKW